MRVEAHVLRYGDDWLVPYVVRHYLSFCDKLVIHDAGGGHSLEMIAENMPAVSVVPWDCPEVNDIRYAELRNSCWKGSTADWVIVGDMDEFIYLPEGAEKSLGAYTQMGAAAIRPHGFEMFSETYPTTQGQIYDEIKFGAPDDKWYGKPILFCPKLVSDMRWGLGSHECDPVLHDGRRFHVGPRWPFAKPPCWLLHWHHIGPAKDIGDKYDATITRMCAQNKKMHWGNLEKGSKHVADKRANIVPNLTQLIP
jgi:hypothetical protein